MRLDLLKEFVKLNKGKLEIFSHEGYAFLLKNGEFYYETKKYMSW